ncbi:hypothetical protein LIER_40816 [Lithospermum erythrorhizon]|uniref:Uncharacterized protein n=1 Tax=Lithospermum erythrorhizon TaxID=34254 RepID=A0AAV3R3A3_LITER
MSQRNVLKTCRDFATSWNVAFYQKNNPHNKRHHHVFKEVHPIKINQCSRTCKRQDAKICIGISSDMNSIWLINMYHRGSRKTIEGMNVFTSNKTHPDIGTFGHAILLATILGKYNSNHGLYFNTDNFTSHIWTRHFSRIEKSKD